MNNKKYLAGIILASSALANTQLGINIFADNTILQKSSKIVPAGTTDLIGINADTTKAKSSLKYFNYFKEYGEMYGIDPYLLMAIASTESAGNASAKSGNNYGLMQINFTGTKKTIQAFNFNTNKFDTVTITSSSQLLGTSGVALNIKVGAMILQEKARDLQFNPLASIQGYNFGQNGFKRAIAYYVLNGNVTEGKKMALNDSRITNYLKSNDTDWITKTFNGKTAMSLYTSNGGGGTASYINHVLGYYMGENLQPWIMDLNRTRYIVNGVKSNEKPDIIREEYDIFVGDDYDAKKNVKAIDKEDGDLTRYLVVTRNTVDTTTEGEYDVSYAILDSDGNRTDKSFKTLVKAKDTNEPEVTEPEITESETTDSDIVQPDIIGTKPDIIVSNTSIKINEKFNPLSGVKAIDKEDGDLTQYVIVTRNTVNVSQKGIYQVSYAVLDRDGNRTDKTFDIEVVAPTNTPPEIIVEDKEQLVGKTINPLENAKAIDKEDGDLTYYLIVTNNTTNNQVKGTYTISYAVLDRDGNRTDKTIYNTVK